MAHHKAGFELTYLVAQALRVQHAQVHGPHHWWGWPLASDEQLRAHLGRVPDLRVERCLNCFRDGSLRWSSRVVNVMRDPFDMVRSGYLYHVRGSEATSMRFADGGERGNDLRPLLNATHMARYNLPAAATGQQDYPTFLLPFSDGCQPSRGCSSR